MGRRFRQEEIKNAGWPISERASPVKSRFSRSVCGPRPLQAARRSFQASLSLPRFRSPPPPLLNPCSSCRRTTVRRSTHLFVISSGPFRSRLRSGDRHGCFPFIKPARTSVPIRLTQRVNHRRFPVDVPPRTGRAAGTPSDIPATSSTDAGRLRMQLLQNRTSNRMLTHFPRNRHDVETPGCTVPRRFRSRAFRSPSNSYDSRCLSIP